MAMLTKQFETIQLGNRNDVCVLCAKKTKLRFFEASKKLKGDLEGKHVLRATSEICYCISCLKEVVEMSETFIDEGVNI